MTQRGVEVVLGRLATDEEVRRRFRESPLQALRELRSNGIELSSVEIAALESLDPGRLRRFAHALDPRLQRAALVTERTPKASALEDDARTSDVSQISIHGPHKKTDRSST
jgi:hypothetical protein